MINLKSSKNKIKNLFLAILILLFLFGCLPIDESVKKNEEYIDPPIYEDKEQLEQIAAEKDNIKQPSKKEEIANTNDVIQTTENIKSCDGIDSDISPKILDFLGCDIIQILSKPDQVNSFKLKSKPEPNISITNRLGVYPIQVDGQGQNLENADLQKFQALVFSEKSYSFDIEKGCRFRPDIGFHFVKDDKSVEILFSFSCSLWSV